MRRLPLNALLFLALAAPALAAPNPYGLNIAWEQCHGDGGTANRLFACNTNSGSQRLVLSFKLDQPIQNANGMEIYLSLASESPALPPWWSMKNAGTCRPTSLTFNMLPQNPGSPTCLDWDMGQAASGIGYYNIGVFGPNTVRMAAVTAVPIGLGITWNAGQEYFAGNIVINHQKTVGTGACTGCQVPVCITFSHARLFVDGGATPARVLNTPANTPNSQLATWQSGQFMGLQPNCDPISGVCSPTFTCSTQPVHSHHGTWGALKSLYR
jgi:hypothetical protein